MRSTHRSKFAKMIIINKERGTTYCKNDTTIRWIILSTLSFYIQVCTSKTEHSFKFYAMP
uniref:Uncharacterized protein n=1 Tax=Lepeophtheirus salmonis TaxID=72036 RepID=A0A0K2UWI2_LEPSM